MRSLSHLAVGLSFLFGCLLLGLVAEIYYVFWWKKRFTNPRIQDPSESSSSPIELSYLFCWKSPISVNNSLPISAKRPVHDQDLDMLKNCGEESVESELMRLHNLCGPPRFLFTINEETKEDLESEEGKSRGERTFSRKGSRSKSLGELLACVETPYLTPLASPTSKSQSMESYYHHGFNPLFESSTDAEINKLKPSPPPTFKFLRDAEEKLMKKLMEAAERKCGDKVFKVEEKDDNSFITVIVNENQKPQYHSTDSKVLPLVTPSAFKSPNEKSTVQ